MSERRYGVHDCPNGYYYLRDVTDHSVYFHRNYGKLFSEYKEDIELVSSLLNELADKVDERQATINKLKEENEQLRHMIKENILGRYAEGSLADLEFKAIAYDDIIKLEIPNESEPKLIVTCKPGKVENVKSFCQMFIPFEMYYEIKELEDE